MLQDLFIEQKCAKRGVLIFFVLPLSFVSFDMWHGFSKNDSAFLYIHFIYFNHLLKFLVCFILQVLNARVYDVAIDTPLQKAVNMSNDLNNNIFFKVHILIFII